MQRFNNILLFGGETRNENMPVGFYSSLALLPMRGKPVIWWQLNNLKKWMRNLIILSSIGVVVAYWALNLQSGMPYQIIGVIGVILAAVSVVFCAVTGLAFKNGKANVEKIIRIVEQ